MSTAAQPLSDMVISMLSLMGASGIGGTFTSLNAAAADAVSGRSDKQRDRKLVSAFLRCHCRMMPFHLHAAADAFLPSHHAKVGLLLGFSVKFRLDIATISRLPARLHNDVIASSTAGADIGRRRTAVMRYRR